MNVRELIAELQKHDPEREVWITHPDAGRPEDQVRVVEEEMLTGLSPRHIILLAI